VILKHTVRPRAAALEPLRRRTGLRWLAIALGVCGLVVGSTLWGLYEGMRLYRDRIAPTLADLLDDVVASRLAIVPNWIVGWVGSDAERVVLDIKHAEFQKLAYQREVALRQGVMVAKGDEEFVKARIRRHGEPTRRAEVRLKGDWVDHLSGPKWSFRVKLKDDQTLFGMETFSLQHPKTRRFVYEWVFHQALAREDIIPLRYEFVELTLNGKDLGVYALEEHFDKRTVEKAKRREGPILKFDESLHWSDIAATGEPGDTSPTGMRGFRAGAIDVFRAASLQQDPVQRDLLLAATTLLEAFRAGELPVAAVFDSKKLATYFALLDLLGPSTPGCGSTSASTTTRSPRGSSRSASTATPARRSIRCSGRRSSSRRTTRASGRSSSPTPPSWRSTSRSSSGCPTPPTSARSWRRSSPASSATCASCTRSSPGSASIPRSFARTSA
jgi:hypothetical protein